MTKPGQKIPDQYLTSSLIAFISWVGEWNDVVTIVVGHRPKFQTHLAYIHIRFLISIPQRLTDVTKFIPEPDGVQDVWR